jgi:heat shock protein HspQ
MPGVFIEQFGITKVVRHLLVPGVFTEQFGITKVVRHLLMPGVALFGKNSWHE